MPTVSKIISFLLTGFLVVSVGRVVGFVQTQEIRKQLTLPDNVAIPRAAPEGLYYPVPGVGFRDAAGRVYTCKTLARGTGAVAIAHQYRTGDARLFAETRAMGLPDEVVRGMQAGYRAENPPFLDLAAWPHEKRGELITALMDEAEDGCRKLTR